MADDEARRAQINAVFAENRIFAFNQRRNPDYPEMREANPPQRKLLEAWGNPAYKVFTYSGGNRIGKCVTYSTLIETPDGEVPVGVLFENSRPFKVYAWDGGRKVVAQAKAPFKKEDVHQCYRITLSDGRWIEAADKHLILTSEGYVSVDTLSSLFQVSAHGFSSSGKHSKSTRHNFCDDFGSFATLLESKQEHGLKVHPLGVVSLSERQSDFLRSCFESSRQYDAQPRMVKDNAQVSFPLSSGVRLHGEPLLRGDGLDNKYTSNCLSVFSPLSILDDLRRNVAQAFGSLAQAVYNTLSRYFRQFQVSSQLCFVGVGQPRPFCEFFQQFPVVCGCNDNKIGFPYNPPAYCDCNSIISIKPIGVKHCYDFEVEKYHNYFAGGLINHNTTVGAIIAISTVLGEWPWSGEKLTFPHKEPRKVRYVGQAWESHIKAVVEPALDFWWPKSVKVETKKNNQGVDYFWNAGRKGSVEIMSNVQDSSVFEGWSGDLVVYDEPPKRDVRVAAARGLIDRQGRELFCMTLLKEAWIHREVIKATLPDGSPDMSVYNISGDIYSNVGYGITAEGVEQFKKTLTEDEIQARLFGKPSYMSSLVFPKFNRQIHVKERFKIPLDALVDIQIDFHPSKKWAVVFLATLKSGFKYVCDEIWDRGNPKYIAEEILRRIRNRNYERVNSIGIDPLAKGGEGNDIDVYSIMAEALASRNYSLETASKDKDNGIAIVNDLLLTENEMPGIFFFKDCVKTIEQVENLMYDPETFKAQKTDDDFTECLYRLALKNTQWYPEVQYSNKDRKPVML